MRNNGNLLSLFNNYTFNSAAQSVLSALTTDELSNLLEAI
jgi:hypothetical protein